jgi:hypothetical protein
MDGQILIELRFEAIMILQRYTLHFPAMVLTGVNSKIAVHKRPMLKRYPHFPYPNHLLQPIGDEIGTSKSSADLRSNHPEERP